MLEMEKGRKHHCGECLRRRLVCDSTRPLCQKCSASGVVCPGYNGAKSLRWLTPGRIIYRSQRKRKGASSEKIENDHNEIMTSTKGQPSCRTNDVDFFRFQTRTEICDTIQYAQYYNTCIYQDLAPINELGPNPHVYPISPTHLQDATGYPVHFRLIFVCMALSHRINRMESGAQCNALAETFYRYRGIAIRSLNEDISVEHKRMGDAVIAAILMFLLVDAQQGASSDWRYHLEGVQRLITLRGGIRAVGKIRALESLLLCFLFVAVIRNTTCAASDLAMTSSHLDELDLILEQYGDKPFRFQLCPPPLFAEIIKINHLRMRATKPTGEEHLSQEAYKILHRINAFSSEHWAEPKPSSPEDWLLLGNVYQNAVAIYCISSLQSLSVLPVTSLLKSYRATDAELLHKLLNTALSSPRIKRFVLWPLVVLGTEAVNGGVAMRTFVQKRLSDMSCELGTYVPLAAKSVLEKFWASGETRWDACFDRPYAFTTQIAVDVGRISPLC